MTLSPLASLLVAATALAGPDLSRSTSDDGAAAAEPRKPGAAATFNIVVRNDGDAPAFGVVVEDSLPPCLDLAAFDPERDTGQVAVVPGPSEVRFDRRTRTVVVAFLGPIAPGPAGEQRVTLSGLAWGAPGPACCNRPRLAHAGLDGAVLDTLDAELGAGPTCASISSIEQRPPRVRALTAVRSGDGVDLIWDEAAYAESYNVWRVRGGQKQLVPEANVVAARSRGEISAACSGVAAGTRRCHASEPAGAAADQPELTLYQARGVCADGSEGTLMAASCGTARSLSLSSNRPSIPAMATLDGNCAAPGPLLPITFQALVLDGTGSPVPDCEVMFFIDYSNVSSCGRGFGEFCGPTTVALSDLTGIAAIDYTLLQEDLDFCNCLPSGSSCLPTSGGLCPASFCAPTCNATADLFCQISVSAYAGTYLSLNSPLVEYAP